VQKLNVFVCTENAVSKIISHVASDLFDKIRDQRNRWQTERVAEATNNFCISIAYLHSRCGKERE